MTYLYVPRAGWPAQRQHCPLSSLKMHRSSASHGRCGESCGGSPWDPLEDRLLASPGQGRCWQGSEDSCDTASMASSSSLE